MSWPISASGRPPVIYVHFLEASELAISASGRPAIIYVHFSGSREPAMGLWEACSYLCPLLRACSYLCPFFRGQKAAYIRFWEACSYLCPLSPAFRALDMHDSPQRVAPDRDKSHSRLHFARSTRTISAEGCDGQGQIALSPAFRALDTHDLRRGLRFVVLRRHCPRP